MDMPLQGKKVLLIVGPDFEDQEVIYPKYRMMEAGASLTIAGLGEKVYKGKHGTPVEVDGPVEQYEHEIWDAVIIPGGWAPDKIRMNHAALNIVGQTALAGHTVAAICHGGWVLASARILEGRTVTSYQAIKDDLVHAGATWVDQEVVIDNNLVTSRRPADLPAFCRGIIQAMSRASVAV